MAKRAPHSLRPDPANLPASSPLTDVPSHANDPRVAGGAALLEAVYPGGVREPGDPVSLSSGMRLRSCEILAGIGAGGMGEVYRASDPDRMARFEPRGQGAGLPQPSDYGGHLWRRRRALVR